LRQAYDYWQDQPDYYRQAHSVAEASERAGVSFLYIVIVPRAEQARRLDRPRDWCFRDLQPTRSPLAKC